jgi:excinuclease ABC subunit B
MYADRVTDSMRYALDETDRRRAIQLAYNEEHGITAASIIKGVSDISDFLTVESKTPKRRRRASTRAEGLAPHELEKLAVELEEEMLLASRDLRFEYAARLRDELRELRRTLADMKATA